MKLIEVVLVIAAVTAVVLNLYFTPSGGEATILMLMTLAMFYMFAGTALYSGLPLKSAFRTVDNTQRFTATIAGVGIASMSVAVLFKLMFWPGAAANFIFGTVILIAVSIVATFKYKKTHAHFYKMVLIRTALALFVGLVAFAVPTNALIDIKYAKHPQFAFALKQVSENPTEENWAKLELERQRMKEK